MNTFSFGTDGIRTRMGTEPLTPTTLITLGTLISHWAYENFPNTPLFIAHDTRYSAPLCKASLKVGLLQGNSVIHDYGIIPTPLLYHLTKEHKALGIMITASHNKAEDNGIKLFTPYGKIGKEEQENLLSFLKKDLPCIDFMLLGKELVSTTTTDWYQEKLQSFFPPAFLKHKRIILDCANGAFSKIAPEVFSSFGAHVTPLCTTPDGYNINKNCGSLYPEILQDALGKQCADIGFAFDGDGDRLTVVTKDGIVKNGDDILSFLLYHPRYKKNTHVVGTIMANQGFEIFLKNQGRTLIRTNVGDSYVTQKLKEEQLTLGGEPSGHIILRDFSDTSDALFTALRICETALQKNDWTLATFTKFPQMIWGLPVTEKKDLTQERFATLIHKTEALLKGGRVLIRYSGTEPLLRVMIEAQENIIATTIGKQLCENLTRELND